MGWSNDFLLLSTAIRRYSPLFFPKRGSPKRKPNTSFLISPYPSPIHTGRGPKAVLNWHCLRKNCRPIPLKKKLPFTEIVQFRWNMLISAKKTHVFRKGASFRDFCEKDARFLRGEFVDVPNNSRSFREKRTNSLNVYEMRTFSEKGCHFCEFSEKDTRFPRV